MAKIMVVDDEPEICEAVKSILEIGGHTVVTVPDGPSCLAQLRNEEFDLVLLDYFMPRMSGVEVCKNIRYGAEYKNPKVVLLTVAEFDESGRETLKNLNITGYIRKPFDNLGLLNKIREIIED